MILRLDIDRRREPVSLGRLCWLLRRAGYRLRWFSETRSPSGTGWHCEAATTPVIASRQELVALQAILGSDVAREACNLQRARTYSNVSSYWRKRWNVLYG